MKKRQMPCSSETCKMDKKKAACGDKGLDNNSSNEDNTDPALSNEADVDDHGEEGFSVNLPYLPDVAIREILNNIPSYDAEFNHPKTILSCRLVCVQWDNIIINTSGLIKKITFPVSDVREFVNLSIAKSGKIRSIKLTNSMPIESDYSKYLDRFIEIIRTIEKVEFSFCGKDFYQNHQMGLFEFILAKCKNLQELIVVTKGCTENYYDPGAHGIFHSITAETVITSWNTVKKLSLNLDTTYGAFTDKAANGVIHLLLKLPNLKEIELRGLNKEETERIIYKGICKYFEKFGTTRQLKKLSLIRRHDQIVFEPAYIALLNLCIKYQVTFQKLSTIDLSCLQKLPDTQEQPINLLEPLIPIKFNAQFTCKVNSSLANLDRLNFLIIGNLNITFQRQIRRGELNWIRNLQCLENLTLTKCNSLRRMLTSDSGSELREAFLNGVPWLKTLEINNLTEIFELTSTYRWPQYFPILQELHIINCKLVPYSFIAQLTVLESLSKLVLVNLPDLIDITFTIPCKNRFTSNDQGSSAMTTYAPAITCFRSLKLVHLCLCPFLTEYCVSDGIAKCEFLEKLVIEDCLNLKENCHELVKCEVELIEKAEN